MARVLGIDFSWYLHRAYHVAKIREDDPKKLTKMLPVRILSMVVKDAVFLSATHVFLALDAEKSFRYKIYSRYKENRHTVTQGMLLGEDEDPTDVRNEVYDYLPRSLQLLHAAGFQMKTVEEMEADDIMASGSLHLASLGHDVFLGTHDKDLLQVVGGRVKILYPETKKDPAMILSEKDVFRLKGVWPKQIRDYLILMGDAVDSIPGVPKIKEKTAVKILQEHGSIKACLNSGTKIGKKLRSYLSTMHLAKKLVELNTVCWKPKIREVQIRKIREEEVALLCGGKVPDALKKLHVNQELSTRKGLFR